MRQIRPVIYTCQSLLLHSIFVMQRSSHETDSFHQLFLHTSILIIAQYFCYMQRSPHEIDSTSYLHASIIIIAHYFVHASVIIIAQYFQLSGFTSGTQYHSVHTHRRDKCDLYAGGHTHRRDKFRKALGINFWTILITN